MVLIGPLNALVEALDRFRGSVLDDFGREATPKLFGVYLGGEIFGRAIGRHIEYMKLSA